MSDEHTQGQGAEAPPPKRKGRSRAVRWLAAGLVLSVSLNLLIVGFAATRAYSHWGKQWSGRTSIGHVVREGRHFVWSLPRERRRELMTIVKSRRGEFRADSAQVREAVRAFATALKQDPYEVAAVEEDWGTEYLAPVLSVKVVDSADEAMEHIERYGSRHTDAIVTENHTLAMRFLREVDSSSVMVNASTRFADGFEYGLGAEIGISTDKLHARGPVGLEGLTSRKYIVLGNGHIRR